MGLRFSKEPLLCSAVVLSAAALFLAYAVGGTRAAQLWCFLLAFVLFLNLADGFPRLRTPAALLLSAGALLLTADTGLRGFLKSVYQSDLHSGFVVESVANTHPGEAMEYLQTVWPDALLWSGLALLTLLIQGVAVRWLCRTPTRHEAPLRKLTLAVLVLCLLLSAAGWLIRPWRHQYPVISWIRFANFVQAFKDDWATIEDERADEERAAAAQVLSSDVSPKTIVLMIGESMTRDNMSLYGYPRKTTPELSALAQEEGGLRFIRDAWSADASTVASFRSMFDFRLSSDGREPTGNLFAFFKAAGWHITWISNQDDSAIKSEWAGYADDLIVLNRLSGRSTRSLDGVVLEPLRRALAESSGHRLIVVHMIGAHPHFLLRHPEGMKPLWPDHDEISKAMDAAGRSAIVRLSREQYDLTVVYQDQILSQSLNLVRTAVGTDPALWFYLSDHGVETGLHEDRTGHSQTTPSGYRIPLLMWASPPLAEKLRFSEMPNRSFRSDWLSPSLLDAAGIRWKEEVPSRSVFSEKYRWEAPESKRRFEPEGATAATE